MKTKSIGERGKMRNKEKEKKSKGSKGCSKRWGNDRFILNL
jgi:hypothetical protein